MIAEVTIESAENKAFRRSIEDMVRGQRAQEAAEMLLDLLGPLCSAQGPLPRNFLETRADSITFVGWNMLRDSIWKLDQCGEPVSAISLDLAPHRIGEDDGEPVLATRFFFDTAWPFSECTLDELLDGFNDYGSAWHNDHADTDERVVGVDGLGAMAQALERLHQTNADPEKASDTTLRAELLGTLYMGVLFHIAVHDMARRSALPRAMALLAMIESPFAGLATPVLAACEEVAPSAAAPEPSYAYDEDEDEGEEDEEEDESESDAYETSFTTLLSAPQYEESRNGTDSEAWHLPPPGIHTTGTQLRRKLVTEQSISELQESRPKGLLARLLRR